MARVPSRFAQLLTHYSGLSEDVVLTDVWQGKGEGVRRAFASVPYGPPGTTFKYSDINYITLGALVETLSGQPLDVYAEQHIFAPLGMVHTDYLTPHCSVVWSDEGKPVSGRVHCVRQDGLAGAAQTNDLQQFAPTAHNDDKAMTHDELLRGVVHDPRRGAWAVWQGMLASSRPRRTLRCMRRRCWTACRTCQYLSAEDRDATADVRAGAAGGGQVAARLWVGHRLAVLAASRHGLSRGQLRAHRVYRDVAVDGPAVGHVRCAAEQRDPSAWPAGHQRLARQGGDSGSTGAVTCMARHRPGTLPQSAM